jgi:hypothetical protein
MFITLLVLAALVLAGLGMIIQTGSD